MRSIEVSEKTVELAIEKGLEELGVPRDSVEMEVLSAGGLFSKARVKLTVLATVADKAREFLEGLFKILKIGVLIDAEDYDDEAKLNLVGTDLSLITSNNGEVFDALQYLASLVANKGEETYKRVILDCEDYRAQRESKLEALAEAMAAKAVNTRRRIKLEPMNPYQRRIIHTKLQNNNEVTTHSEGVEPYRCLIISPKNLKQYDYKRQGNGNGYRNNNNRGHDNRRRNNQNNNRNSHYVAKKDGSNKNSYSNGANVQKLSGFSTGTLIKRNSFGGDEKK